MARQKRDSGKQAVSLLATAFVILIGAVATAFMVLSAAERSGWTDWVVWAVLFSTVVLWVGYLFMPADAQFGARKLTLWLRSRKSDDDLADFKWRRRSKRVHGPTGDLPPPSIDSVREASEFGVRWVPRGQGAAKDRPSPRK